MRNTVTHINKDNVPRHVAVIMDGNGRWAKRRGMPRIFGHRNGVKAVRECSEAAAEIGVEYLTLYAFSTENWSRPAKEVSALMGLLVDTVFKEVKTLNKNNIRLQAIGNLERLPKKSYEALLKGIKDTTNNTGLTLILALNYSGRWELTEANKKIARKIVNGELSIDEITEETIIENLETATYPDPELLIRTSGEHRISNFLLWQIAYTELYFIDTFWPDFRKEHFNSAILDFQNRERRFGKTSEQIN